MTEPIVDEIAPDYIREKRISLALRANSPTRAGEVVIVEPDYSGADPEGVVLPLVFDVRGPNERSHQQRTFRVAAPSSITFKPFEGGTYVLSLREAAHNRWWGSLTIEVEGDQYES